MPRPKRQAPRTSEAASYRHREATLPARPEIGTQAHFKKAKPPAHYRFDSSLAPELCWDGENPARETAEALIAELADFGFRISDLGARPRSPERDHEITELRCKITEARRRLRGLSGPFLNWSGKAERLSFDVPTLPLFVHERLSTKAILETLQGHRRDKQDDFLDALYGFQERPLADQLLRAYEHRDAWVNRLILGDSLVVMNSLLRFESLGGQVQMIYVDPPYGVKFGSNFQPFVRKRDVSHNDDADMTREPEMVQAYRDTWELGLHSYLTYLRDRLLLARELLHPSGSIFVQISDENLHHVREVLDEVFGAENSLSIIPFRKKTMPLGAKHLESVTDYLLWYSREKERMKFHDLFEPMSVEGDTHWNCVELPDGTRRKMTKEEVNNHELLPSGSIPYQLVSLYPAGVNRTGLFPFEFRGKVYRPKAGNSWLTNEEGMNRLAAANRLEPYEDGETLRYVLKLSDSPVTTLTNLWSDTSAPTDKHYVVQTSTKVIQRCLLMTTDPGDLVLDPTCGSGTTAYVAEQWGRRWITCDTSRVPLALARQRLLTATFDYYEVRSAASFGVPALAGKALDDSQRATTYQARPPKGGIPNELPDSPANGFVYKRRQNQKGEEVGGIIPYISKGSIANNEPPAEEVLVDRPEVVKGVVRVSGPFVFEATIPTAEGLDSEPKTPGIQGEAYETYVARMLEVLRRAPVLRLPGNQTVTLKNIRPPTKTLALSAEAVVDKPSLENLADDASRQPNLTRDTQPVAILFGPENGPISERLVREAWDEAGLKHYTHLYVVGFAIDPKARQFIESAAKIGLPCTYLQATMDLQMGDLLKNMRSSQIFSVCGSPDVKVSKVEGRESRARRGQPSPLAPRPSTQFQVELLGLDTFDPVTMEADHLKAADVPAWFLDTDYNGMVFRVRQAFFPRTGAWENLKRALKVEFEDTVWGHLAGTTSAPFPAGEHGQIAVKVIDPRGNELLVVKKLEEEK